MKERTVKGRTVKIRTVKDRTVKERTVKDRTVKDRTVKERTAKDRKVSLTESDMSKTVSDSVTCVHVRNVHFNEHFLFRLALGIRITYRII